MDRVRVQIDQRGTLDMTRPLQSAVLADSPGTKPDSSLRIDGVRVRQDAGL